jgi:hypothetical protein
LSKTDLAHVLGLVSSRRAAALICRFSSAVNGNRMLSLWRSFAALGGRPRFMSKKTNPAKTWISLGLPFGKRA